MAQTWREQKKNQLKGHLYEVALELFRDQGYEQTTVALITERAGVAKGTFFNHFPSKEHVLAEWYRRLTLDAIEKVEAREHGSAREAILSLMAELTGQVSRERHLQAIKVRTPSELIAEEERHLDTALSAFLDKWITRGKELGEFERSVDNDLLSSLIVTIMTGLGRDWYLAGHGFDVQERLHSYIDFVFRAAEPGHRRSAGGK
jgi:AcrR family transcriptional regulator